jgi:hypothetical protein
MRNLRKVVLPLLSIVAILTFLIGAHIAAPATRADDGDFGPVDTHQDFLSGGIPDGNNAVPGPSSRWTQHAGQRPPTGLPQRPVRSE